MSIAQRHNGASAFRSSSSGYAVRAQSAPRRAPLAPRITPRRRSGTEVWAPSRQRGQNMAMVMMVVTAAVIVTIGLAYLSGYARLTQEGYQRAKLKGMLRQERELAQQWRQRQALITAPATIEHKAILIGMVRCDDRKTITVPRIGNSQP